MSDVLLVPVDLASGAVEVVTFAADLARRLGAAVVLQHVVQLPDGVEPAARIGTETALELLRRDAREALDGYAAVFTRQGVVVRLRVDGGPAAHAILEAARAERPLLVVVGTHGRSGFARLLLGSVAEEVLRHAVVPVLTIKVAPGPPHRTAAQDRVAAEANG